MTWIRRPAAVWTALTFILTAAIASSPNVARADTPEPPNATIPCQVQLVGTANGVADPIGEFSVIVRDLAQNPMAGVTVLIELNTCPDLRVATVQPYPGVVVDCLTGPVGTVRAITDNTGTASFRIVGGARNATGGSPGTAFKCASVFADGVFLGRVNVGAFDENGVGGVNPVDVSLWLMDLFTGVYVGRSDYDCTGTVGPPDLSRLLSVSLAGSSTASAAAYCN